MVETERHPRGRAGYQMAVLGVVAVLAGASFVNAPYPRDLALHHVGTAVGIAVLLHSRRRWPLGDGAFTCVAAFLAVHVLGARYLWPASLTRRRARPVGGDDSTGSHRCSSP